MKKLQYLFTSLVVLLATPAFAQGTASNSSRW